jgi:tetratricopeptide (TPR) repeat protein
MAYELLQWARIPPVGTRFCWFALVYTLLTMAPGNPVAASLTSVDPNRVAAMSDDELKQAIETLSTGEYKRLQAACLEARDRLASMSKRPMKNVSDFNAVEAERLAREYEEKRSAFLPVESELRLLQWEWDRRMSTPEDVKEFDTLLKYRRDQYRKGVGTREEMVAKFKEFVAKYPDSTLVPRALYDAAILYTSDSIRETGVEPRLPEKARELHGQIVTGYPDLLVEFVVWSRGSLACLCPTADERFRESLKFYKWLKAIGPEQYDATIKWMGREYQFRDTAGSELKSRIDGLLKGTIETVEKNIVYDAKASSDPAENMRLLDEVMKSEPARSTIPLPLVEEVSREEVNTTADPNVSIGSQPRQVSLGLLGISSIVCLSVAGVVAVSILCWMIVSRVAFRKVRH